MSLFGRLFGATVNQSQVDSDSIQPLTEEFTELAIELINDFVEFPNAVWVSVSDDVIPDPAEPWNKQPGPILEHDVKIVFLPDSLEDRQLLKYLKGTEQTNGKINGIMYRYDFEPTLKDFVRWQGKEMTVAAVDPIAPVDKAIIYLLEFDA